MHKKIGLLTLPLSDNFGGMLQIVALYHALSQTGFDVTLIDKRNLRAPHKALVAGLLERLPGQNIQGMRGRAKARARHAGLLQRLMPNRTAPVRSGHEIEAELARLGIDTVIVGSDQVWRFEYQGDGAALNYFLDFGGDGLRRLSYAASFGHGTWRYPERTEAVRACLSRFDGLSVRESSGQEILRKSFGIPDAALCLDPTALLSRSYYEGLCASEPARPGLLCYTIDQSAAVTQVTDHVAAHLGRPHQITRLSPHDPTTTLPQWLGHFRDADFVVTESFHGVVFSVLFEKPFLVLPNNTRGRDRFTTFLGLLGLEDRLLDSPTPEEVAQKIATPPDFAQIHPRLEAARHRSLTYLHSHLEHRQ